MGKGKRIFLVAFLAIMLLPVQAQSRQKSEDAERLGRAIEYFSTGKYHEALLFFQKLDKDYELNARFKAYMGVCYYYDWDYRKATEYIDSVIPQLDVFAPHERSFYYYASAESHFNLSEYGQAIPLYEKQLTVCYDNEKADSYYRLGFCYMFLNDWASARERFESAEAFYERFRNTPDLNARITQIKKMLKGIDEKLNQE